MPRQIIRPGADAGAMSVIAPIEKGGTGASTPQEAVVNLGGVSRLIVGQPQGLVQADERGYLPTSLLVGAGLEIGYGLDGPEAMARGQVHRYRLTNYNSLIPAVVSVSAGSVEVVGDELFITAPASGNSVTVTVGERQITIPLVAYGTSRPAVVYPTEDALVPQRLTLIAKPFRTIPAFYSDWTAIPQGETITQTPAGAVQLELRGRTGTSGEVTISLNGTTYLLPVSTTYRRIDIELYGSTSFHRSGSAEMDYRWVYNTATHVSTDWQVATNEAFTNIVLQSLNDPTNLLSWNVELNPGEYYVRTRFSGELTE